MQNVNKTTKQDKYIFCFVYENIIVGAAPGGWTESRPTPTNGELEREPPFRDGTNIKLSI